MHKRKAWVTVLRYTGEACEPEKACGKHSDVDDVGNAREYAATHTPEVKRGNV